MPMVGYFSKDGKKIRLRKCEFCKENHSFNYNGEMKEVDLEKICYKTDNIIKLHVMIKPTSNLDITSKNREYKRNQMKNSGL